MIYRSLITLVCLVALFAVQPARAARPVHGSRPPLHSGDIHGGRTVTAAKAVVVDTQLIIGPWGSDAPHNGQFETPAGQPDWNGWTTADLTETGAHWNADSYHAINGAFSAWCGDAALTSCGPGDPDTGGYGNNWNEYIEWRGTVADPTTHCTVNISAVINHDVEFGYDYAYVRAMMGGLPHDLIIKTGIGLAIPLALQVVYLPVDYEGPNADEIVIRFHVTSDGSWSDEDCSYQSAGALQVDDVQITLSNGTGYSHDFEDGTLGDFQSSALLGAGNFAKLWTGLQAAPGQASSNTSSMVAFIDDGLVVPGTGGTTCVDWCYGPDGYIVNNTGGLIGPAAHIYNVVRSPILALPHPEYDGVFVDFDTYRHEMFTSDSGGMTYPFAVRSTADTDPAGLNDTAWIREDLAESTLPKWYRARKSIGPLIVPNAQWIQIQFGVFEQGWVWGFNGPNGTSAPYYDNVSMLSFPFYGSEISAKVTELPHDNFPASETIDLVNLGQNSVRFDMGQVDDILAQDNYLTNIPGDSVMVKIIPRRNGAVLSRPPRMYWALQANPLFDPYRTAGLGLSGFTEGGPSEFKGTPIADTYSFDLPETGFLFPGDELHYYFEASDEQLGVVHSVTLPADTTGFGNFADPLAYQPEFRMRALPSLRSDGTGGITQPGVLFWDDAGDLEVREEWLTAFRQLGLVAGFDYDIYRTNEPSIPAGHGLGGRSNATQLAGYDDMIYTSGVQSGYTISYVSVAPQIHIDRGVDLVVLKQWLWQGGKDLLLTGDDLAGDMERSQGLKQEFMHEWMGVDLVADDDIVDLIDGQAKPLVAFIENNPVFRSVPQWRTVANTVSMSHGTYTSTGVLRNGPPRFDGVTVRPGAQRLAQFMDPSGDSGTYEYSAATLNVRTDYNARVVSLPYDLQAIWDVDGGLTKTSAPVSARALILGDVLNYFGHSGGVPAEVPLATLFSAQAYPNPFNPATTISYHLPQAGQLSIRVYDIKGRLVSSVFEGRRPAGSGQVKWDGRTTDGAVAAAGVYFYEARAGEQTLVGKMSLIK